LGKILIYILSKVWLCTELHRTKGGQQHYTELFHNELLLYR